MALYQTAPPARAPVAVTEVVASYTTLEEAEAHVLALRRDAARPPAAFVAARGPRAIETNDVVPPVSMTVALGAAASSIGAAVIVGLFGALDPTISPLGVLALAFYALIFGAVGGALIGGLFYVVRTRNASPLEPPETFVANRFDVLVEHLAAR